MLMVPPTDTTFGSPAQSRSASAPTNTSPLTMTATIPAVRF
jgi:hypothetical protein